MKKIKKHLLEAIEESNTFMSHCEKKKDKEGVSYWKGIKVQSKLTLSYFQPVFINGSEWVDGVLK